MLTQYLGDMLSFSNKTIVWLSLYGSGVGGRGMISKEIV